MGKPEDSPDPADHQIYPDSWETDHDECRARVLAQRREIRRLMQKVRRLEQELGHRDQH